MKKDSRPRTLLSDEVTKMMSRSEKRMSSRKKDKDKDKLNPPVPLRIAKEANPVKRDYWIRTIQEAFARVFKSAKKCGLLKKEDIAPFMTLSQTGGKNLFHINSNKKWMQNVEFFLRLRKDNVWSDIFHLRASPLSSSLSTSSSSSSSSSSSAPSPSLLSPTIVAALQKLVEMYINENTSSFSSISCSFGSVNTEPLSPSSPSLTPPLSSSDPSISLRSDDPYSSSSSSSSSSSAASPLRDPVAYPSKMEEREGRDLEKRGSVTHGVVIKPESTSMASKIVEAAIIGGVDADAEIYRKRAMELLMFLSMHRLDPDNVLVGRNPKQSVAERYESFLRDLNTDFSRDDLLRRIVEWDDKSHDHQVAEEVHKFVKKHRLSIFRKYFSPGDLLITRRPGDHLPMFVRFVKYLDKPGRAEVSTSADESKVDVMSSHLLMDLPDEIVDLVQSADRRMTLVNTPLDQMMANLRYLIQSSLRQTLEAKGADLEVFSICKEGSYRLRHALPIALFLRVFKTLQIETTIEAVLAQTRDSPIHIFAQKEIDVAEFVDRYARSEVQRYKATLKMAQDEIRQKEIKPFLNGTRFRGLNDLLNKTAGKAAKRYLRSLGWDKSVRGLEKFNEEQELTLRQNLAILKEVEERLMSSRDLTVDFHKDILDLQQLCFDFVQEAGVVLNLRVLKSLTATHLHIPFVPFSHSTSREWESVFVGLNKMDPWNNLVQDMALIESFFANEMMFRQGAPISREDLSFSGLLVGTVVRERFNTEGMLEDRSRRLKRRSLRRAATALVLNSTSSSSSSTSTSGSSAAPLTNMIKVLRSAQTSWDVTEGIDVDEIERRMELNLSPRSVASPDSSPLPKKRQVRPTGGDSLIDALTSPPSSPQKSRPEVPPAMDSSGYDSPYSGSGYGSDSGSGSGVKVVVKQQRRAVPQRAVSRGKSAASVRVSTPSSVPGAFSANGTASYPSSLSVLSLMGSSSSSSSSSQSSFPAPEEVDLSLYSAPDEPPPPPPDVDDEEQD